MNSKLKENIGSYIWRKFGTLGYLTGAQLFKARQFTHLVCCEIMMAIMTAVAVMLNVCISMLA